VLTLLFWNLGSRSVTGLLQEICNEHGVDIAVVAESSNVNEESLRQTGLTRTAGTCPKVTIYARDPLAITPRSEAARYSIRVVRITGKREFILGAAHFPSRLNWSIESLNSAAVEMATDVASVESDLGHDRTMIVGDFNMNPFDTGMVSAHGFHGVMTRTLAGRARRAIQGRDHKFFYNPMWRLFGAEPPAAAGTHFNWRSEPVAHFWEMYDQVLLRPELAELVAEKDISILFGTRTTSFLKTNGEPDTTGSDHLPILVKLNI